ncbi:unnamed protein product [Phytomonas sp. EM1]|nr:unnamed protein product [Phytomonas sp. EM1]|eukprot:CCW62553.1 unnamed protein product [Phytomonas sp. isolate EM1]
MAVVFIFDVSLPEKDASVPLPLSWQCASELTSCATWDNAMELWKDTKNTKREIKLPLEEVLGMRPDHEDQGESEATPYALETFPRTVIAKNKYFRIDVQPIVGYYRSRSLSSAIVKPYATAPISNVALLIQQTLRRCSHERGDRLSTQRGSEIPFGCVFTAHLSQDPREAIPWETVPLSHALFSVVLVYHEKDEDLQRAEHVKTWRQECLSHQFEFIPHRFARDARGALEVIPAEVGSVGLLKGLLTGSSRVAQILCNTLWPSTVRRPLSEAPSASFPASQTGVNASQAEVKESDPINLFLVISSDFTKVLRSFTQPNFSDGSDENGEVGVRPRADRRQQDIRFLTIAKQDLERFPPSVGGCPYLTNNSIHRNHSHESVGINADREVHANGPQSSSFPPSSLDEPEEMGLREMEPLLLVNRYFSALVAPLCVHPALFDSAMSDRFRMALETMRRREGFNTSFSVVFWSGEPSERLIPLSDLLDQLIRLGFEDVKVVIPTTPEGVMSIPLTAIEEQVCAEKEVEVISLGPFLSREVDSPNLARSGVKKWELEEGVSGADRLREVLHCVTSWKYTESTPKPLPWHCFTLSPTPCNRNRCFLHLCAGSAWDEEIWARHLLSHALPSFSGPPRVESPVASCLPSLTIAGHPNGMHKSLTKNSNAGCEFVLSNKYFSTRVDLFFYGGVCSREWRQEAPRLDFLETCQAFIMLCTRETLHLASLEEIHLEDGGKPSDDAAWIPTPLRGPSPADLAWILRKVQGLLAKQWKEEQEDLLGGSDGDGETDNLNTHATTDLGNSSVLKRVALLYVVDADPHNTALMDGILEEVDRILFGDQSNTPPRCNSDDIHDAIDEETVNFSLIEVVGMDVGFTADQMGAVRPPRHAESFETEGCTRIREALEQHRWLFTQNAAVEYQNGKDTEASKVEKEVLLRASLEQGSMEPETELHPRDTLPTVDQGKEQIPSIGCEPPRHYLMDPQSLRTEPVLALLYFNMKRKANGEGDLTGAEGDEDPNSKFLPNDLSKQKNSIKNDLETEYYTELMAWVKRMKLYGDHLPPSVRQLQAEVLTLALGEALS